jgi:undecaprenyl-phosphate galactose phosphotransferase
MYLIIKRIFDIFCSLIGLVFIIPLTIVIKVIYMLSGDFASVFYFHERIGKNGKTFKMFKYRTMVTNSAEMLEEMLKDKELKKEWDEFHKFENDPRITKIGNILRKTSLDEIPQIINILVGDMSVIGPRPMIQEEVDDYGKNKNKLLSMRPGLTGWWACNGRSCTSNKQRKKLELYYIDNCSIWLDIKVIFKTVIAVLKRDGAK